MALAFPQVVTIGYTPPTMFLLANMLPTLMFLAGCALLTAILLRRSSRYHGKRTRQRKNETVIEAQPRPTNAWTGMHRDTTAHIERQKVELHDMTRESTGRLDSKMLVLQELIAKSDQQIERMEALLSEMQTAPTLQPTCDDPLRTKATQAQPN